MKHKRIARKVHWMIENRPNNKETRLSSLQKAGILLMVGATAGNLVGCTADADTSPKPASTSRGFAEAAPEPASAEVTDDQYVDKLELTKVQLDRVTEAAKATAVARIDFIKERIAETDPNNKLYSVDHYDDGSLVMASYVHTDVEQESYNLETRDDMLYTTPVQSANGLEIKLALSHNESCYMVGQDSFDAELCKTGQSDSYNTLTFVNPESKVFSDFFLTEEDLREYLASPDTTLLGASKSKESTDAQGETINSQFVSVDLDGATVLRQGTKDEILAALTNATNY